MNGNRVVVNTLPATMTSARRKCTRLSPSVTAFGAQKSRLRHHCGSVRRCSSRYVSDGHSVRRRLRAVHAVRDVLMTHDRRPDAGPRELQREERPANAGIGTRRMELQIAARPVRMETRIGDELNGALAQPADGSNRLISEATGPRIDHERSLVANLHDDVSAISHEHGHVVSNAQHVNLAVRGLGIDGHADTRAPATGRSSASRSAPDLTQTPWADRCAAAEMTALRRRLACSATPGFWPNR